MFFFESWGPILRIGIVGTAAYAGLVLLLRISGSRSLAKLNAFDFVVTVALGSTLASILLDKKIPLAEGLSAFVLLLGLQFVVSFVSSRWPGFEQATRSSPVVVFSRGVVLHEALLGARLTEGDLFSAIRQAQVGSLDHVEAVVLETSGELSVLVSAYTTRGSERTPTLPKQSHDDP